MSLTQLLLSFFLITPVCQYLLTSPRFPKNRGFLYACFFLAGVAISTEIAEYTSRPPNYYRVLDVDRGVSQQELKKAYREATLKWHPDKNKAQEAQYYFQLSTDAYETLSDINLRVVYDRFGRDAIVRKGGAAAQTSQPKNESELLLSLVPFYIIWSLLTYLMTAGKTRSQARQWSFIGLIVSVFVEWQMISAPPTASPTTTGGVFDIFNILFKRMTQYEQIQLIHTIYPSFMHACILLSQFTYVDTDSVQIFLLQQVYAQQQEMKEMLRYTMQCVDKKHHGAGVGGGGPGGATLAAGAGAGAGVAGTDSSSSTDDANLTVTQRLRRQEVAVQKSLAEAAAQKQGGKTGGIPSWLIMIGLYVLFNYVLK